jgi:unsaturated chondroitin disaccharide hydrolase
LFELAGFVEGADHDRYLASANHMLDELASPAYLAEGSASASILLHGTFNVPAKKGIDVGLAYGDYYFLEAIARWKAQPAAVVTDPGDPTPPPAPAPPAGSGSTGPSQTPPLTASTPPAQGCSSSSQTTAVAALALVAFAMSQRKRLRRS